MRSNVLAVAALALLIPASAPAQDSAAVIENAMSAAPLSVSRGATITDHEGKILRQGANGWVCMADNPTVPNNSPMCLDAAWRGFIDALMKKAAPTVSTMGISYMLVGDMPVSNTDPFATAPTPTNQWIADAGPHIMLIVPDARSLDGLPTDPANGGPWVMWKDTPYAHVMIPVPAAR